MCGTLNLPAVEDLDHAFFAVGEARWRSLQGANLFISGGTGFVGKWMLATLLAAKARLNLECSVTLLTRDPDAFRRNAQPLANAHGITLLEGDVRTFQFPTESFSHVVHAATDVVAQASPIETFDTCVTGTRRVMDFARQCGVEDLLLVSSGAVYGRQPPELERVDETYTGAPSPTSTASAYGEGKRASEWIATTLGTDHKIRTRIARCFAFVGPYLPLDKHFAVGNFLRCALEQDDIVIEGDGTPFRTYMHAADMAAWLWAILLAGEHARAYNVGGHEVVSIAELARRVAAAVGGVGRIRILKQAQSGCPAERYVPDVTRARAELNLPEPISLDAAIARTAAWHQAAIKHST